MVARLVPLATLAVSGFYLTQAIQLPFGTAAKPGAGFYPVAVAVFACAVALMASAWAFLSAQGARAETAAEPLDPASRRRVRGAVAALAGFCLLLPWIGYPIAAFGFVSVVLWGLGGRWQVALLTGALASAGSYYLFGPLLGVPLPVWPW
jgi:tripartite tricarboxylate transporter TctB family protein